MIDHLPDLMEAGVDCIKLEGRAKSAYYAAIVTGAYRHGIDAAAGERPWTRYGGMRWSMCPTGSTPQGSIMASLASIRRAPGISASGRFALWCWTAAVTAWPP